MFCFSASAPFTTNRCSNQIAIMKRQCAISPVLAVGIYTANLISNQIVFFDDISDLSIELAE